MRLFRYLLAAMTCAMFAGPALADKDPVYTARFSNVAEEAYDAFAILAGLKAAVFPETAKETVA